MADASSSLSTPHTRPTTYIHRACINCRHRKMRCGRERPACRRCLDHPPRSGAPCKYSHMPTGGVMTQQEESEDIDQVLLMPPYLDYTSSPSSVAPEANSPTPTPSPIEETSQGMLAMRLDVFLNRFTHHQFFFLDPAELRSLVLMPLSDGDFLSCGLLNAALLWGDRLSQNHTADRHSEEDLLARTVSGIARDITMLIDSSHRTLQVIQAEVLLSLYYMEDGRFLEGSCHRATATSLAFSTGLHRLGHASYTTPFPPEFLRLVLPVDTAARSAKAFWAVVILNNYWVAASGIPSSIPFGVTISIPWPTTTQANHFHSIAASTQDDVAVNCPLALLANASILLERAVTFTSLYQGLSHPAEFGTLDYRLESFRGSLFPICGSGGAESITQTVFVTHVFVHAASLQLHAPHIATSHVSHAKCLSAAGSVAELLGNVCLADWEYADPVVGPLLASFAEFLIAQLPLGPPFVPTHLEAILSALRKLASRGAFIAKCYSATQQRYAAARVNLPEYSRRSGLRAVLGNSLRFNNCKYNQ
ncbi:hypothetical protein GGX14DRAFT_691965 [Mycena pura]|uniref:Zn(2)-C6 fungal-type domain-containing protein n=1 Tax=Mycena pura TaxID=153505 RepID=A0AAD7E5V9_9AGAR|nr:hypothetical protein GGX14DRAFT_691965 [Mycena pura]